VESSDICAIIVFYRRRLADSDSLRHLVVHARGSSGACRLAKIVAYDNSPEMQEEDFAADGFDYVGDSANGGVTPAYNHALRQAQVIGATWLLLLDQDTCLPSEFWRQTS
jgi:hypothetical protein